MIRLVLWLSLAIGVATPAFGASSLNPCDYYGERDGDVIGAKCCNPDRECRSLVKKDGNGQCKTAQGKSDPAKECVNQKNEYACVSKSQCSWRAYKPAGGGTTTPSADAERH